MKHIIISIMVILLALVTISNIYAQEDPAELCQIEVVDLLILREQTQNAIKSGGFFLIDPETEDGRIPNETTVSAVATVQQAYYEISLLKVPRCAESLRIISQGIIFTQYVRITNFMLASGNVITMESAVLVENRLSETTIEGGLIYFDLLDSFLPIKSDPAPDKKPIGV